MVAAERGCDIPDGLIAHTPAWRSTPGAAHGTRTDATEFAGRTQSPQTRIQTVRQNRKHAQRCQEIGLDSSAYDPPFVCAVR